MTLKVNIYMFGLTKWTIYCKKCSCFCSCFSLHCILCSFFRLKELFQVKNWFNYVVTSSSSSFFENAKNLSRPATTLNGEKKKRVALAALWSALVVLELRSHSSRSAQFELHRKATLLDKILSQIKDGEVTRFGLQATLFSFSSGGRE